MDKSNKLLLSTADQLAEQFIEQFYKVDFALKNYSVVVLEALHVHVKILFTWWIKDFKIVHRIEYRDSKQK